MKKTLTLPMVLISVIFLNALLFTGEAHSKKYNFTYSIFFPASHDQFKTAEKWARQIEKETNGKVKITMFPGGTLTKAKNCYNGVVNNISDIGMSCFAYTRGRFPVMEACDLPLGYKDGKTASTAVNHFHRMVNPKELEDVKVLYLHAHGPGRLHTIKPVHNLEDLEKMKIRSTGLSAKVVNALGGIPVAMSQGSTYESLKKGVVEGSFGPTEVLKGWRQADVVKSTTNTENIGYTTSMFVVMNKRKWKKLPDDIKEKITKISDNWSFEHGKAWDKSDEAGKKYSIKKGNQYLELSIDEKAKWTKKVEPVINEYIENSKKKGIDAEKNIEILRGLIK